MLASPLLLLLLATAASADIVTLLSEAQSGQVLGPSHPDYEDRRKVSQGGREVRRCHVCTVLLVQVMNAACTARPAVIVVPNTSEDVAAVVRAASSSGLELSVRSGGHSYTCTNLKEGGVHVDMRSAPHLLVI